MFSILTGVKSVSVSWKNKHHLCCPNTKLVWSSTNCPSKRRCQEREKLIIKGNLITVFEMISTRWALTIHYQLSTQNVLKYIFNKTEAVYSQVSYSSKGFSLFLRIINLYYVSLAVSGQHPVCSKSTSCKKETELVIVRLDLIIMRLFKKKHVNEIQHKTQVFVH